jgi:RimJ/RimL family protein N-acetyltransferase
MDTWIALVVLEHGDIRLQPLEAKHAPDLLAAADRELFRFTPQMPPEWSVAGFERDIARVNALANVVAFAIVHRPSGRAIGRTTYMDIQAVNRGVEIGRTWIGRAWQGTTVNPTCKFLMLRHAFESLTPPAVRVQFCTGGTNLHSQAAIAKLGAVREGVLRSQRIVPSGPEPDATPMVRDTVVFSILPSEWPGVRQGLLRRLGVAAGDEGINAPR